MEEIKTRKNVTNANPFTVPDGYFERLRADIMASLPERGEERKAAPSFWRVSLARPVAGLAATLCAAVFGASVYTHSLGAGARLQNSGTEEMLFASDDASDYIMLDNDDIYRYLADMDW